MPKLTSPYGWRTSPTTGRREFHDGDDYADACGTLIAAPIAGCVEVVKRTSSYGWSVEVFGDDGLACMVAHVQRIFVRNGEHVERGTLIAELGGCRGCPGAGRSTGCHTHYRERVHGKHRKPRLGNRLWEVKRVLTKEDERTIRKIVESAHDQTYRRVIRSITTGWVPTAFSSRARKQFAAWLKRLPWIK